MEWKPINTAPKPSFELDGPNRAGPRVLLAFKHGGVYAGSYSYTRTGKGRWRDDHCMVMAEPTHWAPIPRPPTHSPQS
jgi:hypothetical protein